MKLCVFFTYGMSLKSWNERGLLDRELALYKKLSENGVEVTFLTYGEENDRDWLPKYKVGEPGSDFKVIPVGSYSGAISIWDKAKNFFASLFIPIKFDTALEGFDFFKTNQMWGAWVAVLASMFQRTPLIVRCGYELYDFELRGKSSPLKKAFVFIASYLSYARAKKIILTSFAASDFVQKHFEVPPHKLNVIPNFIDTEKFAPNSDGPEPGDRVLFVGRFNKQKNIEDLIMAASDKKFGLDLVGFGELESDLKKLSEEQNADVNFLGKASNDDLPSLINSHSVFVLPTHYEGNPKVLLEAMSCAAAVVGTRAQGVSEIIRSGENGILAENNPKSLGDSIDKLLSDRKLRSDLGVKAREFIISNCSLDNITKLELKVYQSLIEEDSFSADISSPRSSGSSGNTSGSSGDFAASEKTNSESNTGQNSNLTDEASL